jgi:hypothetical protein
MVENGSGADSWFSDERIQFNELVSRRTWLGISRRIDEEK